VRQRRQRPAQQPQPIEPGGDQRHLGQEGADRRTGIGQQPLEPVAEQLEVRGDVDRVAGHAHAVEALAVVLLEGHFAGEAELAQEVVDGAPLAAVPDVVQLGVEAVGPLDEGVAVAARVVVGLEHPHRRPGVGQQRPHRKPGEAAADDQGVRRHSLDSTRSGRLRRRSTAGIRRRILQPAGTGASRQRPPF
jgi:hypothetical protein